jgi:glycerol-3-phosphate acyltransferase PlsY
MTNWIFCILAAYVVGAIPFGYMIGRWRGVDIRQHGSKNVGATNVGRLLGRRFGVIVFLLDSFKGAAPVFAAGWINGLLWMEHKDIPAGSMWLWLAVAAATMVGHMYSIFLRFGGGKGVATGFGAMIAMWPVLTFPALGALVVWYATLRLKRYMSLAAIAAAVSLPVWYLVSVIPANVESLTLAQTMRHMFSLWPPLLVTALLAVMVIYRHRSNIGRIMRGEEPRVGQSARRNDAPREKGV